MNTRTRRGIALLAMAAFFAASGCSRDGDARIDGQAEDTAQGAAVTAEGPLAADGREEAGADQGFDGGDPMMAHHGQIIRLGASMQALAEACDLDYDRAELESAKQQQREGLKAQGVSERAFNAAYQAAYEEGVAKLKAASATERAEACAQMKQFEQMGQALQQR